MCPIGEYVPDSSESILSADELPKPEILQKSINFQKAKCPQCGKKARRHKVYSRDFHDLGNPFSGKPRDIHLTYSQHFCKACEIYFFPDVSNLVAPYSQYSRRVVNLAIRLVVEDGLPYGEASWNLWRDHRVWVPRGTVQNWVEESGKKRCRFCNRDVS